MRYGLKEAPNCLFLVDRHQQDKIIESFDFNERVEAKKEVERLNALQEKAKGGAS